MRFLSTLLTLSSSLFLVDAFPAFGARNLDDLTIDNLNKAIETVQKYSKDKRFIIDFSKPIDTTGKHSFQAPGKADQRGPCPGLNVLANHGYISRNGITSLAEVVTAINQVLGMGIELSLVLGVMGTVWTGNPLSLNPGFSIGGTTSGDGTDNILGNLLGLLGNPRGLQGSHNWIESDSSLTRDDLYVTGDAWTMNMTLFRDIYDRADENGVISMDLLAEQAARRWEYSVAHNPNFYYGPVTGTVSRNAGYLFLGRLLSNHTEEHPDGILTQEVFKKFFAVYEDTQGNLEYRKGHETFPDNWYRKPIEYGLVPLNLDLVNWILQYPVLGSIGGNTGTVNSFSGLDLHDITGGVLNATSLLENNNLLCFVFQVLKTFLPNSLSSLLSTIQVPVDLVTSTLAAPLLSLACPAWEDLTEGGEPLWDIIQRTFPGASKAESSL
ncbi:Cloroperoxidase [Dothidotthia symphoricarpi CBS 119687]|uniref:Cloroperoxidase n=1 Tax=Dothidotthia symphoricarpi CBS 119687 TaxID=1392245 RepID=A0A6A5ZZN1_9PLEO|nr:Cloroperoxidase [Dothidotthia symphoricarpi CBS 119687]KAF2123898.1 Cloroperoxidase [Dothidotthia symphoricarpi CBS 119687]